MARTNKFRYDEVPLFSEQYEQELLFKPFPQQGNQPIMTKGSRRRAHANPSADKHRVAKERVISHNNDDEMKPSVEEIRKRLGLNKRRGAEFYA